MDLWIRSQDRKSLIKVTNIEYTYQEGNLYTDVRGKHHLGTYYDNLKILGTYNSKERALEVLDKIQNLLDASNRVEGKTGSYEFLDLKTKVNMLSCVYEMPRE